MQATVVAIAGLCALAPLAVSELGSVPEEPRTRSAAAEPLSIQDAQISSAISFASSSVGAVFSSSNISSDGPKSGLLTSIIPAKASALNMV